VHKELGRLPFIVEDLGVITPDVQALRDQFQLPGTRVLQWYEELPDHQRQNLWDYLRRARAGVRRQLRH
jgi:4-alpha-glucanotransferase